MSIVQLKLDDMRGVIPPVTPTSGCFIAGGSVRRWFTGHEDLSDVDVFAPAEENHTAFLEAIGKPAKLIDKTKHASTYLVDGVRVQLIKFFRANIDELFSNFDFNVCQFAWTEQGVFATQEAVIGVLRGHLAVGKIRKDFAVDSLRRTFKYQMKGFEPCAGTIRDIARSFIELTEEEIKKQVEQSPKGGKRIVRFD